MSYRPLTAPLYNGVEADLPVAPANDRIAMYTALFDEAIRLDDARQQRKTVARHLALQL